MEVIYANKRIEKFIVGLSDNVASKVERIIDLLEKYGHKLGMPHSKSLGGGLFELRVLGERQIRVLYVFDYDKIYVVHAFLKKTERIPKYELDYAYQVAKEVLA